MTATIADLLAVERLIKALPAEKVAELANMPGIKERLNDKWLPNPGQQTLACDTLADELFYGGEAGGGKSSLVVGLSLARHYRSLVLRRTNVEALKFVEEYAEVIGSREGWNGQDKVWRIGERVIDIRGCQHEDDKQKFKGSPHDLICFDEVSDFSETQYRFIIGWNRTTKKGQRCRVLATGNPPTSPEGLWVLKYWGAWIDPTHPNPAQEGELRWYTTIAGEDTEVDGPGPHVLPGETKPIIARSRTFIRGKLSDNPDLEEQGYDSVLAALPEGLRQAYREGRFDVALHDDEWQVIPTAWILAAQERWKEDDWKGLEMTAMAMDCAGGGADASVLCWRYGGWYAPLDSIKGDATADGSAMASRVLRHRKDNAPIVVDAGGGYAGAVIERFKDNGISYSRFNGADKAMGTARGSGLRYHNKRAEAWWRFREELDPDQEGGSVVALPPGPELRADLAAPHYELRASGILIESKDDIRKRIGRSPDKGDAVVMCLSEGNKAANRRMNSLNGRKPRVRLGYAKSKQRR